MKLRLVLLGVMLLFAGCTTQQVVNSQVLTIETVQGVRTFNLDIAQTEDQRKQGLMDRTVYPSDSAMLFVFDEPRYVNMWMKNTLIPLDMLMIDDNKHIVQIYADVPPCELENSDDCPLYTSSQPISYVVEINAGLSKQFGIDIGDTISF